MKDYFGCNDCKRSFAFLFARKPESKKDKEICEETGWDFLLRKPRNKEERKKSKWYYTLDLECYDEVTEEYLEDVFEFEECDLCKAFINTCIKKSATARGCS